jgi:hypothetical protein
MKAVRRLCVIVAAFGLCLRAQDADPLLAKARQAMRERLANTPNYACVLEIDRAVYPTRTQERYRSKELARLEIAVVGGREQFAWPGDSSTQESIEALLGPGLSSTGEFSAHGRSTFLDPRSSIERLPDARQTESGKTGYAYRVPIEASRYMVAGGRSESPAPYAGQLWVGTDSGELERFEVQVSEPPANSGFRRIDSFVTYEARQVSGRPAWLPSEARIVVESAGGRVFRNDLRFLGCRAFQAEATIRFDAESLDAVESSGSLRNVDAPAGLELSLEFETAFDSKTTRAGDRFEARLLEPAGAGALLPKGASIHGRVRRLALIDGGSGRGARRVTTFTLELLEARWEGHCGRLSGTLRIVDKIPKMAPVNPDGLQLPKAFFNSERALGYRTTPRMSAKGFGTFVVLGELYAIPKGARMKWKTEAPPAGPCSPR